MAHSTKIKGLPGLGASVACWQCSHRTGQIGLGTEGRGLMSQSVLIPSWCLGGRMGVGLCALISPCVPATVTVCHYAFPPAAAWGRVSKAVPEKGSATVDST